MTVLDYIKNELSALSLVVSEIEITILLKEAKLSAEAPLETAKDLTEAKKIICKYIPSVLMKPNITEGGFSISYDRNAIMSYYNFLCGDLGLQNKLQPKVRFTTLDGFTG